MHISAVSQRTASAASGNAGRAGDALGRDDFLKLLIAQLQHQDPLRPVDDKEFIAQLAQFRALEQMQEVNTTIAALYDLQQLEQATGLIGRTVRGTTFDTHEEVEGIVSQVGIVDGVAVLRVGDDGMRLSDVAKVMEGGS